jgi:hypothetical protein
MAEINWAIPDVERMLMLLRMVGMMMRRVSMEWESGVEGRMVDRA